MKLVKIKSQYLDVLNEKSSEIIEKNI